MPEVTIQDALRVRMTDVVRGEEKMLDASLTFRLSKFEYAQHEENAEAEGRSVSSYIRKLLRDGSAVKEKEEHSPSVNPWGRQLADGMPIRVWLTGQIIAAGQKPWNDDPEGLSEFAKEVLRLADAIEGRGFQGRTGLVETGG